MATDADKVAMPGLNWDDCDDIDEYDFKPLELNCRGVDRSFTDATKCVTLESGNGNRKSCTVSAQDSPRTCDFRHVHSLQSPETLQPLISTLYLRIFLISVLELTRLFFPCRKMAWERVQIKPGGATEIDSDAKRGSSWICDGDIVKYAFGMLKLNCRGLDNFLTLRIRILNRPF